jgi:hypothetical protein
MCGLESAPAGAPFFIEWAEGVVHPASSSPSGCQLESWTVAGPDPEALQRLAMELGLDGTFDRAAALAMRLALLPEGPRFLRLRQRAGKPMTRGPADR